MPLIPTQTLTSRGPLALHRLLVAMLCAFAMSIAGLAVGTATARAATLSFTQSVANGRNMTCVLTSSSQVQCFGDNTYGELGNGTTTSSHSPVTVLQSSTSNPLTSVASIAAGDSSVCAVLSSGAVWCWGNNSYGQLGNGTTSNASQAVDTGITNAVSVEVGYHQACAVLSDATVTCWGQNDHGQLGDGTTTNRSRPTAVTGLSGALQVITGEFNSCAVINDGTVKCWGYNGDDEDGVPNTTGQYTSPVTVANSSNTGALTGVIEITSGRQNTCALTTNSLVWCWGATYGGQGSALGATPTTDPSLAINPSNLPAISSLGLGYGYDSLCAISTSQDLWCWGENYAAQLGNGKELNTGINGSDVFRPAKNTSFSSNVATLSLGFYTMCAITTSSALYCWGYNNYYQVGVNSTGTNNDVLLPTALSSVAVAAPAPGVPTGVTARSTQPSSADVSWSASTGNPTSYTVTSSPDGATCTTSTTSCTVSGLTNGTAYTFTVVASNGAGSSAPSSASASVTPMGQPGSPSITNIPTSPTYGGSFTATVSQSPGDGAASIATSTPSICQVSGFSVSFIGAGQCSLTASTAQSTSYRARSGSPQSFTVSPAPLTITASSQSSTYGSSSAARPAYSGFVNGDTIASLTTVATCSSGSTSSSPVGTYSAACSGAADPNYSFTYRAGTTSVVAAPLTVYAPTQSISYGTSASLTPTYSGFVAGDTVNTLSSPARCSTTATTTSHPGNYPISCSGAVGSNYAITFAGGTVTVTAASSSTPTISDLPNSVYFGTTFTPTVNTSGDGATSVTSNTPGVCGVSGSTVSYITVGTCTLVAHVAAGPNYSAADGVAQSYVVNQATAATPTITNIPTNALYGQSFTPTVATNGDGARRVTSSTTSICVVNASSGVVTYLTVGTCTLVAHVGSGTNYLAADGSPQSFTVSPAPLAITASSGTSVFNQSVPTITASYSGFVNGETASSALSAYPVCSTTAKAGYNAGTYAASCTGAGAINYAITYVAGTVTITPATPVTPTITNLPLQDTYDNIYTPIITTNGDGVTSVISATPTVCMVAPGANEVVYVGVGTCTLTPTMDAGLNYLASTGVPVSYTVAYALSAAVITYGSNNWWTAGYSSSFTISNPSLLNVGSATNPWSFSFQLPRGTTLVDLWNGVATSTPLGSGTLVTVVAPSFAHVLYPGETMTLGFTTAGTGAISNCMMGGNTCVTSPDAPTAVTATASSGQATVSWTAPSSTGSVPIASYVASVVGANYQSCKAFSADATPTSCTITGLTNGTSYTFVVRAVNSAGASSSLSTASNTVTPLGAPIPVGTPWASTYGPTATVNWIAPYDTGGVPLVSYTVTAASTGFVPAPCVTSVLTCTFKGLTEDAVYTFTVTATNANGFTSAVSSSSSPVTINQVPAAPMGLWAWLDNGMVRVSWGAPTNTGGSAITGYTVTASPSATTPASCIAITAVTCAFTGLADGTSYTFSVIATNAAGYSSVTSVQSDAVTPYGTPDAPTGVTVTAGSGSATVSWTAVANAGGSTISGYRVTALPGGIQCTSSTTSCTVVGLTNGVPVSFSVVALTAAGTTSSPTTSTIVTPVGVSSPPVWVQVTPGNSQVAVSWIAPHLTGGAPVTGYTVTAAPGGATCTSSTTSCVVTGLTNGVAYTFSVTATNAAGNSAASPTSASVTPATITGVGSLKFLYVKTATYRSGYQAHYTLINKTANTVGSSAAPWSFTFTLPEGTTIGSLWNANYAARMTNGITTVTVWQPRHAGAIAPGKSRAIYFTTSGRKAPTNCLAGGTSCAH